VGKEVILEKHAKERGEREQLGGPRQYKETDAGWLGKPYKAIWSREARKKTTS